MSEATSTKTPSLHIVIFLLRHEQQSEAPSELKYALMRYQFNQTIAVLNASPYKPTCQSNWKGGS
jgi:hypothetical protein